MQEVEPGIDQLKIQVLGKETENKFGNKEEEKKVGCLSRGIREYELKDYAKFWLHEDMQHPQSGGMLSLNLALT